MKLFSSLPSSPRRRGSIFCVNKIGARLHGHDDYKIYFSALLLLAIIFSGFLPLAAHAAPAPVSAIAMQGMPKYPADFSHFDYVNPNAPQGGTLHLGVTGSFDSLNPFIIRGNPALGLSTGFMSLVYESLLVRSWDEPFTLYGLIAASIEVPEDRSSITFNLRPEAHWQDGVPITAADVLFSFETLRKQGRPNHRLYYQKVVEAVVENLQRIRFSFKPDASGQWDRELPLIIGLMPILPQHDWLARTFNQTTLRPPLGSGPYKVAKLEAGRSISYQRDENYWGNKLSAQRGLYNFAQIRIDYYRDDAIALQAFKSGAYDLRREQSPTLWATAYDFPAVQEGRVRLERFTHGRPEPISGFTFNTRRELFKDITLRAALDEAFDFGWINQNLFHGQYHRSRSFFPNSELAAPDIAPAESDGTEASRREHLRHAAEQLKQAGYTLHEGQLQTASGTPVSFEVLLSDPLEEKIALHWAQDLVQLGIMAHIRTVDAAQFQARLSQFDFDVTVTRWVNSLSPGNEQMLYWGSAAANTAGSRNYAGIHDAEIDRLAATIPAASSRIDLVNATRALDQHLMAGHYLVPFYYLGADFIASWQHIAHPSNIPLYGLALETWWAVPDTATIRP